MVALVKCGASCDKEVDMELLARLRGPSNFELTSFYQKFSPGYWDAVENDKAFKTNVLVKSWCRINISKNNKSVIEYAKEKGACEKIIKMLLVRGCKVDLVMHEKVTHSFLVACYRRVRKFNRCFILQKHFYYLFACTFFFGIF
jgi:hypothetical protein